MAVHTVTLEDQGIERVEVKTTRPPSTNHNQCEATARKGNIHRRCRMKAEYHRDGKRVCRIHAQSPEWRD